MNYGFVAFSDHPSHDSTYITQVHNLVSTDEILKYFEKLNANGEDYSSLNDLYGIKETI